MIEPGKHPTTPPERLLLQQGASETLRADLLRARDHLRDPSYDVDAGLEALQKALGSGVPANPPVPRGGSLKLALVVGGVLALGGAVVGASSTFFADEAASPAPGLTQPVRPSGEENVRSNEVEEQSPEVGADDSQSTAIPPSTVRDAAQPSPAAALPSSRETAPLVHRESQDEEAQRAVKQPLNLQDEVAQLKRIRASLTSRPDEALRLAEEGHRVFQGGFLYEEREGLAILALEKLGRMQEAQSRAHRYRELFPKSALLPRMGSLLGSP